MQLEFCSLCSLYFTKITSALSRFVVCGQHHRLEPEADSVLLSPLPTLAGDEEDKRRLLGRGKGVMRYLMGGGMLGISRQ